MALENTNRPEKAITVFAGNDVEATRRAREYFVGYRPSSPAIALFRDGEVVKMLERWNIEGRGPNEIATELAEAFDQFCVKEEAAS
jgi:putative YphP/YqiW family bacilliredoxin